jgi:hypothetical protein
MTDYTVGFAGWMTGWRMTRPGYERQETPHRSKSRAEGV